MTKNILFLNALAWTILMPGPAYSQNSSSFKQAGFYYVLAPSGLNLRKEAKPDAAKLVTIPYGSKVELMSAASAASMTVDQLSGNMPKVKYNNQTGFLFDGYLSRYPAPKPEETPENYANRVREINHNVLYEEHKLDYGGYIQIETALTFSAGETVIKDWQEVYLIAQQLFKIPPKLLFPAPSRETEQTIQNPAKPQYAWTDELKVERNAKGEIQSITYSYRGEASGKVVAVTFNEKEQGMRISLVQIAD